MYQKPRNIIDLEKLLNDNQLPPVILLSGEDSYSVDQIVKKIELLFDSFLASDFDKSLFYGDSNSLSEIISTALTFPFGSDKKLVLVKEFDKIKERTLLEDYVQNPADFTCLILIHDGKIAKPETVKWIKSLIQFGYFFEAKELREDQLRTWIVNQARAQKKKITLENAQLIIDIVGENKNLIEEQLKKIYIFLGSEEVIDEKTVRSLSTNLKAYNIFDLQNSIIKKDKITALKIAFNLLAVEPSGTIKNLMILVKFFSMVAKTKGLGNITINEAMSKLKTTYYQAQNFLAAAKVYSYQDLFRAIDALVKADITIKTSTIDHKEVMTILISEIM